MPTADDPRLDHYLAKRDFGLTTEPQGGAGSAGLGRFVVQQHAARRLHYDVRLEVEGVLVSWAVPKGPSMDPKVKRLAVKTEDHPMDYAGFEGTIAAGQYGGGAVVVWDAGRYHNLTTTHDGALVEPADAVERGRIRAWLLGEKLQGSWDLVRTRRDWLMIKVADAAADPDLDPVRDRPASVLSGRTLEEVATAADGGASRFRP